MMRFFFFMMLSVAIAVSSCKKDEDSDENPFDDPSLRPPNADGDTITLEPGSFAYLHNYIFKPTCSNSGCHDGNFEPDFRTLSSSYNTLVYQRVIQNDDLNSFTYRVEPGNLAKSFLHVRLTSSIPRNASGKMPLSVEPGSDWVSKQDEYITLIEQWINEGAKDPFGNSPTQGNPEPQVVGLLAFESGNTTTPLPKLNAQGVSPFVVPKDKTVDLWLSIEDDKTAPGNLKGNTIKVSRELTNFDNAGTFAFTTPIPISGEGFDGNTVSYTHKVTLDFTQDTIGTFLYLRTFFQDEDHETPSEIPNAGSNQVMKTRFTLKVDSL